MPARRGAWPYTAAFTLHLAREKKTLSFRVQPRPPALTRGRVPVADRPGGAGFRGGRIPQLGDVTAHWPGFWVSLLRPPPRLAPLPSRGFCRSRGWSVAVSRAGHQGPAREGPFEQSGCLSVCSQSHRRPRDAAQGGSGARGRLSLRTRHMSLGPARPAVPLSLGVRAVSAHPAPQAPSALGSVTSEPTPLPEAEQGHREPSSALRRTSRVF